MRTILSLFSRRMTRCLRPNRRPALRCESLEDRLAPAATSLYVTTQAATTSGSLLKEYTTSGSLIRSVWIPIAGGTEYAHDLAVTGNQVRVYNGTSAPQLSTYNGSTGAWTSTSGPSGWDTYNTPASGGLAVAGNYAFASDMSTTNGPESGIVRIDLRDGIADRFATDFNAIDVNVGADGLLYALNTTYTVRVYDPSTLNLVRTVILPESISISGFLTPQNYRAVTADSTGRIYTADRDRTIARFDSSGNLQLATTLPASYSQGPSLGNLTDIDLLDGSYPYANDGGLLVIGSDNGTVTTVSGQYFSYRTRFSAGTGPTYVTSGPSLVEVGITGPSGQITEGDSGTTPATFTVSLSQASAQSVNVLWKAVSSTATADVDFQSASGTLTFAPGETQKTVTVQVIGDTADEFDENFYVSLSPPTNAAISAVITTSYAYAYIHDDDPPATATQAYAVSAGDAIDTYGDGVFETFSATTGTLNPYNPSSTYEKRSVIEFDTAGIDLSANPVVTLDLYVEFPWYQSTTAKIYGYAGDGTASAGDANQTGTLLGTLTNLTGATAWRRVTLDRTALAGLMSQSRYVGIVIDADSPTFFNVRGTGDSTKAPRINFWSGPPPVLPSIDVTGYDGYEGNPGAAPRTITFSVYLSQASTAPITVDYATRDQPGVTAGVDYVATSGTLTFKPGETTKYVTVQLIPDTTYEPSEYFYLDLSNPTYASFHTLSAGAQIINDDAYPTVSTSSVSVTEPDFGSTTANFTVSLSNASYQTVSVYYSTSGGNATAGSDYATTSGVLTFNPGETAKTVAVPVYGDTTYELDETFNLTLSSASNAILGGNSTVTGTIVNNDPLPSINVADVSGAERGAGASTSFTFRVSLSNASYQPITVSYATADGTALAGSDYTAKSGTLTFSAGETYKDVVVPITPDMTYEPDEAFKFSLSSPSNANLGSHSTATGTIVNDDPLPTVSVSSPSVAEGDSGTTDLTFTVSLSNPSYESITVNYVTADGTAIAGSDYTAASGSVTFAPGQTTQSVTVAVGGDTDLESDETFKLNLSLPNGTNATLGTTSVTGTIVNDDYAPVADAGPDRTANEGAAVSFDGSGSSDADNDPLTYSWDFGDGTTGSGPKPTHAYSDNGTYTVTLTVSDGHGGTSSDTAVVTVQNVAPTAGISGSASGVRGQSRTFTLTASDVSSVDQSKPFGYRIDWGDGKTGTASGPGDGSGTPATHTYLDAGTYTIQVWATDKDGPEGNATSFSYTAKAVEVQGNDLAIGGTTGTDQIVLTATSTANAVQVSINGVSQGTFTASGQIVVYAQAGDDNVSFAKTKVKGTTYSVSQVLALFGGDGNDTLDARNATGAAVLVGGDGNDTLWAGAGRSILIGGLGADTLRGGGADDILIGGYTDDDEDLDALAALRAEWARTDENYATRQSRLLDPTGLFILDTRTHDDGVLDNIFGNGGQDWFFAAPNDKLNDRQSNETVTGP